MRKIIAVTRLNFLNTKLAWLIALIVIIASGISEFINYFVNPNDYFISLGWYSLLYLILLAIFIPTLNFKKIMRLNGKKIDYYWGSLINYIIGACAIAVINTIIYFTIDIFFSKAGNVWNMIDLFGWGANGIAIAFIQQFILAFLIAITVHTLTSLQTSIAGWTVDIVLIAILSVFIPIVSLRKILVGFFDLIIFNENAFMQIFNCLVLSIIIYAVSLPVLRKKKI